MNLLLDTHILLWALAKPKNLPQKAANAINVADNVFFSPVNLWEIGIKSAIWPEFGIKRIEDIHAGALKSNMQELLINSADAMLATQLATIHRVQRSQNLPLSEVTFADKKTGCKINLDIEMETCTLAALRKLTVQSPSNFV